MAGGRPTDYCTEIADKICEGLENGLSLRKVCAQPYMPDKRVVLRWVAKHEEFCHQYVRAREVGVEYRFDELEELAATATPESVSVVKLQIDTRKWALSKQMPKKYGDKIQQEHSSPDGSMSPKGRSLADFYADLDVQAKPDPS